MLRGTLFCLLLTGCAAFAASPETQTPIKHLVVIFDENVTFDHYFGTYPNAENNPGDIPFHAAPDTPTVNGLDNGLLHDNPNHRNYSNPLRNPWRISPSDVLTCNNSNHYDKEQIAYNGGLVDSFYKTNGTGTNSQGTPCDDSIVMGYYDGNTVTAMWNYAQHFALSDNFFDTEFGGTVIGHLNLLSGQTLSNDCGLIDVNKGDNITESNCVVVNNGEAGYDYCTTVQGKTPLHMKGKNVGNLLSDKHVTWGWFYQDFIAPLSSDADCGKPYNTHFMPFNFWESTANPMHLPPTSVAAIGTDQDQANHQYGWQSFWDAAYNGNLPSVSFLKATKSATGHPDDGPVSAEMNFLATTINGLMQLPEWKDMAILIAYDDSDGWYDHVMPPNLNQSDDASMDNGFCGNHLNALGQINDRCGYGPRLPFLVISPYAKQNYVSHSLNDQTSILRFIEDNWGLQHMSDTDPTSFDVMSGSFLDMFDFSHGHQLKQLLLNPDTGEVEPSACENKQCIY